MRRIFISVCALNSASICLRVVVEKNSILFMNSSDLCDPYYSINTKMEVSYKDKIYQIEIREVFQRYFALFYHTFKLFLVLFYYISFFILFYYILHVSIIFYVYINLHNNLGIKDFVKDFGVLFNSRIYKVYVHLNGQ